MKTCYRGRNRAVVATEFTRKLKRRLHSLLDFSNSCSAGSLKAIHPRYRVTIDGYSFGLERAFFFLKSFMRAGPPLR